MVKLPTRAGNGEHIGRFNDAVEDDTLCHSLTLSLPLRGGSAILNTGSICNLISFGNAVYEAAQQITGGATGGLADSLPPTLLVETIRALSIGGVPPPDPIYATLAMLALREIGKVGGTLHIPSSWPAVLHRIAANTGDGAVRQVLSVLCYMEVCYPDMLVWEGQ